MKLDQTKKDSEERKTSKALWAVSFRTTLSGKTLSILNNLDFVGLRERM